MAATEMKNLTAGRELDALVAEKVMGWTLTTPIDPECDFSVGMNRDGTSARRNFGRAPGGTENTIPHYSTDIAPAWMVVERLEGRGWSVVTRTSGVRGGRRCEIATPRPDGSGDWLFSDEAPTLPEAICRAALEAVGANDNA